MTLITTISKFSKTTTVKISFFTTVNARDTGISTALSNTFFCMSEPTTTDTLSFKMDKYVIAIRLRRSF